MPILNNDFQIEDFVVGQFVEFRPEYKAVWDSMKYSHPDNPSDCGPFKITKVIGNYGFVLSGFRGYVGEWQFPSPGDPSGKFPFQIVSGQLRKDPILLRVQKLYKKCNTTKDWEVKYV